jgi:hypothetical protein
MRQDIAWFDQMDPKELPTKIAEKVRRSILSKYSFKRHAPCLLARAAQHFVAGAMKAKRA